MTGAPDTGGWVTTAPGLGGIWRARRQGLGATQRSASFSCRFLQGKGLSFPGNGPPDGNRRRLRLSPGLAPSRGPGTLGAGTRKPAAGGHARDLAGGGHNVHNLARLFQPAAQGPRLVKDPLAPGRTGPAPRHAAPFVRACRGSAPSSGRSGRPEIVLGAALYTLHTSARAPCQEG